MKRFILAACALVLAFAGRAQSFGPQYEMELVFDVADLLPAEAEVKGASQGFAISGDYGFFFHDKGQVVIINIPERKFISTYVIAGMEKSHCNNACFSTEKLTPDSAFPLLYLTECAGYERQGRNRERCFVLDIDFESATLVQSIFYDDDRTCYDYNYDWNMDFERGFIYTKGSIPEYWQEGFENPHHGRIMLMKKFPLPMKKDFREDGKVHLTNADVLDEFTFDDMIVGQGAASHNGILFTGSGTPKLGRCRFHVFNLDTHERLSIQDVTELGIEPEGYSYQDGYMYMTFHTPKKPRHNILYRIKID